MTVMGTGRERAILAAAVGILVLGLVAIGVAAPSRGAGAPPAGRTPAPSASPVTLAKVGGVFIAIPDRTIHDPTLLPYPFMSPTPAPAATPLDGTYLRTLTFAELGGARIAMPNRCLRCPPYRIDPGVSSLIFTRGAYYLHHHLSGFRTMGSFVVEGDRVTLFNDPNCPQTPGVYEFDVARHGLRLRVVAEDCPISGERPRDLMFASWTRVPACVRRIQDLWPGEVAC
jgi:hypothetical protein